MSRVFGASVVVVSILFAFYSTTAFQFQPSRCVLQGRQLQHSFRSFSLSSTTNLESPGATLLDLTKQWAFKKTKTDSEVSVSSAVSDVELIRDLMAGILLTSRVLDADDDKNEVNLVIAFPNIDADDNIAAQYTALVNELLQRMAQYGSDVFPIEVSRTAEFYPAGEGMSPCSMLVVHSHQVKSRTTNFSDIDEVPTDFEDFYDNSIEAFPFPSVYDFISEINRPPDPATMAALRFNFQVQDFRGDIKKAAKKKKPQEILDGINCKLTRLQNWKGVLLAHTEQSSSPFVEIYGWSEDMKSKYRSLKYLAATDPKKAMDTQYDKRKVFIQIIDQWSDRLKRYFKYIYHSQRSEVDAQEQAQNTVLRLEMRSMTDMYSAVPYLDFGGPEFVPGKPAMPKPLESDRSGLTSVDFAFEPVVIDTARWIDRINEVQQYAFQGDQDGALSALSLPSRSIRMHSYSRGYSAERLMRDVWASLAEWMQIVGGDKKALKINGFTPTSTIATSRTHHEDFTHAVMKVNSISRKESFEQAKGVKDLYKCWADVSPELVDWWCELVADLNVEDMLEQMLQEDPNVSWPGVMDRILNGEFSDGDYFTAGTQAVWSKNRELWSKYRPVLKKAEMLRKSVRWSASQTDGLKPYLSALAEAAREVDLTKDMVSFFVPDMESESEELPNTLAAEDAMIFVMPRMYRGIGETELGNFLEFCKLMLEQSQYFATDNGLTLKLIPLHPEMVNQKGVPDYSRRAPHPAILFYLAQE